jgi:hypothetical protein
MKRTRLTVLGVATALCLSLFPAAARAATPSAGGLVLDLTGVPGSATRILVQVESPLTRLGAPKEIKLYPLADVPVTGTSMAAMVPASQVLRSVALAQHGNVNLVVTAQSAARSYPLFTPARVNLAKTVTVSVGRIGRVSILRIPADSRPDAQNRCTYVDLNPPVEVTSRVGELHVAGQQGVTGYYNTGDTADNTISVGGSASGTDWTYDGTLTLTNSISANGGFSRSDGFLAYVNSHIYYAEYTGNGPDCPYRYITEATSSVGDSFPGSSTPQINPYSRCANDPNGYAEVASDGGHWNDDRSVAWTYQGSATVFGFRFGGSNGFTSHVNEGWDDSGPDATFVCGNADPVQDSSIFYDGDV